MSLYYPPSPSIIQHPLPPTETIQETVFTILMVNDVYELLPDDNGVGGLAELATIIEKEKLKSKNCIATLNGDFISASTLAMEYKGSHMIDILNYVGIDYVCPGNHEFDFGDLILERIKESKFKWICSNIVMNNENNKIDENNVLEGCYRKIVITNEQLDGLKIGIFSVTTKHSEYLSKPGKSFKFLPSVPIAKKLVKELREEDKCDVVIAITHLNLQHDKELANKVNGIDVIIGGHDHTVQTTMVNGCFIHKAGHDAMYLSRLDIKIEKKLTTLNFQPIYQTKVYTNCNMIMNHGYLPNRRVYQVINKYLSKIPVEMMQEIGITESKLDSSTEACRSRETTFGNFTCDTLLDLFKCDLTMFNGGGIRGDKFYGIAKRMTRLDILKEFPFPNEIYLCEILGKDLIESIELGLQKAEFSLGAFPQFSKGVQVIYDTKRKPLERIVKFTLNGIDLDPTKIYTMATVGYLLKGGDGYSKLTSAKIKDHPLNGNTIYNLIVDWLVKNHSLNAHLEGRIIDIAREKIPLNKYSGEKDGRDEEQEEENYTF
ncbi:hypothetical protein ABK040_014765 [Willaertia magna]